MTLEDQVTKLTDLVLTLESRLNRVPSPRINIVGSWPAFLRYYIVKISTYDSVTPADILRLYKSGVLPPSAVVCAALPTMCSFAVQSYEYRSVIDVSDGLIRTFDNLGPHPYRTFIEIEVVSFSCAKFDTSTRYARLSFNTESSDIDIRTGDVSVGPMRNYGDIFDMSKNFKQVTTL
jgi:hypothetical protein